MLAVPVSEQSGVAEARREASHLSDSIGFGEEARGRVAIVATELASNLVKHGGGGELLISAYQDNTGSGLELVALDKGRGMANVDESLRDGFSTAGSRGEGLGAVGRQSNLVQIASWPDRGTAILARFSADGAMSSSEARWGGICLPLRGEEACGDAWEAAERGDGLHVIVADGLGHGPAAAEASTLAVQAFCGALDLPPAQLLQKVHLALRPTRGAAVSVATMQNGTISFAGIGNVAGAMIHGQTTKKMVSHNGTAGHSAPRMQAFEYPVPPDGLFVMHSDGLATSWSLDRYPGLARLHPTLIAAVLYRDFERVRDDVTVFVARPLS